MRYRWVCIQLKDPSPAVVLGIQLELLQLERLQEELTAILSGSLEQARDGWNKGKFIPLLCKGTVDLTHELVYRRGGYVVSI